jgi:Haem-binding domain
MKIVKKILLALLAVFIIIQFIRPPKNQSKDIAVNDISKVYPMPTDVQSILTKACTDCHSNNTQYPWYSHVQPVAWWLNDHIKDGKRHLNFSEFMNYRIAKQYKKLEECIDEVKDGGMPLESYTYMHKNAKLTAQEKQTISNWFAAVRDSIKNKYPADSLVRKK